MDREDIPDMMANVRPTSNGAGLDVYSSQGDASFIVKTIHLSCSSDAYCGTSHKYGGIIIYGCDGESEWYTANRTHCKSGYLVIQDTDDNCNPPQKQYPNEPGIVHGAIYRRAFGESCQDRKVVGEGFAILNGRFKTTSVSFNAANDDYRDDNSWMHPDMARCVERVVESWKAAGSSFTNRQNYDVKDLLNQSDQSCFLV